MTRDAAASIGLVLAAQRLAEALTCGFAAAAGEGRPLTELQRNDITTAALLAFDGLSAELEAHAELDRRLATSRPRPERPQLRCDIDPDQPLSAADERALDAMGDERAWR